MKSSEEMLKSLYERRDKYLELQRQKKRKAFRYATIGVFFAVVSLAGIFTWKNVGSNVSYKKLKSEITENVSRDDNNGNSQIAIVDKSGESTGTNNNTDREVKPEVTNTPANKEISYRMIDNSFSFEGLESMSGGYKWYGKTVHPGLAFELENISDNDVIEIWAIPIVPSSYVYDGKTIENYQVEENKYHEICEELYELLYYVTYQEKLNDDELTEMIYFNETYAKYLINGKVLVDELKVDYEKAENEDTSLLGIIEKARDSARKEAINSLKINYDFEGIQDQNGCVGISIKLTKTEFRELSFTGIENWRFGLANFEDCGDE